MKEQIQDLIRSYRKKVKVCSDMMSTARNMETEKRLRVKRSCYKAIIVELERIK